MAELVDQYGQPIRRAALLEESDITTRAVRQLMSGTTTGISPGKMANILKASERGDMDAYLSMAEEIEEKDTHYLSVMGTRKRAVSQLEITVDHTDESEAAKRHKEFVQDWLDRDQLEAEIFEILDAIGKGFSVTEIVWSVTDSVWLPKQLIGRDQRLFKFDDDMRRLKIKGVGGVAEVPLRPYKYIVHEHKAKSGTVIRGGVTRACAWMWLFKNFSVKDWVIFSERYGQPIRLGKYGAGASKEDRDVLMRAVSMLGSDAAAIVPDSMVVEFIDAMDKKSSAEVFKDLANFADMQMSKAVLGQTTTTDAISGGHAVSKEHNEVREDIERSDAKQLSSTLNEQLIRPMIDLNFGPQKIYPRLRIGRNEQIDIKTVSEVAERAQRMGMKLSESKLREKLSLPAPEGDGDILVTPSVAGESLEMHHMRHRANISLRDRARYIAAEQRHNHRHSDAIEGFADDMAGDYEEIMEPVIELIEAAAAESSSYAEFGQRLLELAQDMEIPGLADKLAEASFFANIAAQAGADLKKGK